MLLVLVRDQTSMSTATRAASANDLLGPVAEAAGQQGRGSQEAGGMMMMMMWKIASFHTTPLIMFNGVPDHIMFAGQVWISRIPRASTVKVSRTGGDASRSCLNPSPGKSDQRQQVYDDNLSLHDENSVRVCATANKGLSSSCSISSRLRETPARFYKFANRS